jgi:hypothetical protein
MIGIVGVGGEGVSYRYEEEEVFKADFNLLEEGRAGIGTGADGGAGAESPVYPSMVTRIHVTDCH